MEPITAVMITGKHRGRFLLARAAIESFRHQIYEDKDLLIINDGDFDVLLPGEEIPNVRELKLNQKMSLGALRNIGITESQSDWVMQWDDDDFSHPERMAYQAAQMQPNHAIILRWQVRYSLPNNSAFRMRWAYPANPGIPGTVLFHKDASKLYQEVGKKEDEYFLNDHYKNTTIVLDNSPGAGKSHYYLRLHHEHNTWDGSHIMGKYISPSYRGRQDLNTTEKEYLNSVIGSFYTSGFNIGGSRT